MKLATFTWSYTVEVPDDFTGDFDYFKQDKNYEQFTKARHDAFLNVSEDDGDCSDVIDNVKTAINLSGKPVITTF